MGITLPSVFAVTHWTLYQGQSFTLDWFRREMRKWMIRGSLLVSPRFYYLYCSDSPLLLCYVRRRLCLRFFNAIAHSIYYLTARRNNRACARAPRSVLVLPRPQMWFQQLLNDRARIVSKSTHEWPRMTTSDHEWPWVTTSDYKWPQATTSESNMKILYWRHNDVILSNSHYLTANGPFLDT